MKKERNLQRDSIDFGKEKIPRLFSQLFFPTLVGMIFNALLTLIDGVFVGQGVGSDGIAAVNIIAPVYMIVTGIGLMLGIGASVVASIQLSKSNNKAANIIMTQAFGVGTLIIGMFIVAGMLFPVPFARFLGSSDQLMPHAIDYLFWLLPGTIFLFFECVGMMLIRLDGSPKYAMMCNVVAALLNIGLDYIFIFPLGMGVRGAAIATTLATVAGGLMVLIYFLWCSTTLRFYRLKLSVTSMLLTCRNIGYMSKIGFAAFLTEIAISVMMFTGNYVFMGYLGEAGVAAFSIACYLFPVLFSLSNAIAQSAQPIISYNYGLGDTARVSKALRVSLYAAIVCGCLVTALVAGGARYICLLFLPPEVEAFKLAVAGLPKFAWCGIFFALNIAFIGYYQSLEKAYRAAIFTMLRGIIFVVLMFLCLPRVLGIPGLWYAIPASELLTMVIIIIDFLIMRQSNHQK